MVHRMSGIQHVLAVTASALLLTGCQQMQNPFTQPKTTVTTQPSVDSSTVLRQQNRDLRDEIDVLKAEQKAAADRVQELQNRDKTLSAELSKLQFTCSQQAKALDALKNLPDERDQYKQKAEELAQRVEELQAELAKANPAALKRLKAASAPASKPAAASSPATK